LDAEKKIDRGQKKNEIDPIEKSLDNDRGHGRRDPRDVQHPGGKWAIDARQM
jgi:hypothetical protein